jgi:DNA adenine methylase
VRPFLKYHGGKNKIFDWIIPHFPHNYESLTYVEDFVGGSSIILNKKKSVIEIINDINPKLINLYKILFTNNSEFVNELLSLTYSKETFDNALLNDTNEDYYDDIDKAVNTYVLYRMSRGGLRKEFAWSDRLRGNKPGDENAWETSILHLDTITERLNGVIICNKDFRWSLINYNDPSTFHYLDPTYLSETRTSKYCYEYEMTFKDHEDLLKLITQSKAKILISGYDSALYYQYLKDWYVYSKDVINHSSQAKIKENRIEMLWANY